MGCSRREGASDAPPLDPRASSSCSWRWPFWRRQAQERQPILVLVSFDGWRWDYINRAAAPNLRALAARGVRAEGLIPSFPSKTFPNHYTHRDRALSGASRDHLEQHRGSRLPRAFHHGGRDRQGRAVVGRRAALGHGDPSGPARVVHVLARFRSGDSGRAAERVEAVRRQDAERRSAEAGARLAGAAAGQAAVFRHAVLQRGRSRRPRLRSGFTAGARGGASSRRGAGSAGVGDSRRWAFSIRSRSWSCRITGCPN